MKRSVLRLLQKRMAGENPTTFMSASSFSSQKQKTRERPMNQKKGRDLPYLQRPVGKRKSVMDEEPLVWLRETSAEETAADSWRNTKMQFEKMFSTRELVPEIPVNDFDKRMRIPSSLEGTPALEQLFIQNRDQPELVNSNLMPIVADDTVLYRGFNERKFGVQRLARVAEKNRKREIDRVTYAKLRMLGEVLRNPRFKFQPERVYNITLLSGKDVRHAVPSSRDELVLNSMRLVLDAIYEPRFCKYSFGFRPDRGRQVALRSLRNDVRGMRFYIVGEISRALQLLPGKELEKDASEHIEDPLFQNLLHKALGTGYGNTYGLVPESFISLPKALGISPLLVNCYLHKFDQWMVEQRDAFLDEWNPTKWETVANHTQCTHRRFRYLRCGSAFFVGIHGNRDEAHAISSDIDAKLEELNIDPIHTRVDVFPAYRRRRDVGEAHFLGCEIVQEGPPKDLSSRMAQLYNLQARATLRIPGPKLISAFVKNAFIKMTKNKDMWRPCGKGSITYWSTRDIIRYYDRLTTGLMEYYALADNFYRLKFFIYMLKRSCTRTLGWKLRLKSMRKVFTEFGKDLEVKDGEIVTASLPDRRATERPLIKDFYPDILRPRRGQQRPRP